ncbi:3-deoxy-7-phosphoheptulonate synthase [Actinocrinis puniceicyclus]|uniref:3-deoxy-7-phosphoheptulonate synthase n=1 Tax=Actinocrinis puniceicyclus TaxID=977794 RepID=A0A8J7WM83_9ACTN|nr:3-deoxy-7-phosphoheptulonate synthase [Actinocrinis puniceicyclus]MBS2962369.1 3-deoxy-7-phosphoheptulonate synthase [Actinocrinis puniceicyclus]
MTRIAVLLAAELTAASIDTVVSRVLPAADQVQTYRANGRTVLEVTGAAPALTERLREWPEVEKVLESAQEKDLLLTRRALYGSDSVVDVGGVPVGGNAVAVIAGPCSMDGPETLMRTAEAVRAAGAALFRVGLFKPRTSPYSFQGLGRDGFEAVREVRRVYGMPIVTEVLSVRDIEDLLEVADMLQVGARNMQNFPLLSELGKIGRPVLLKRGLAATVREWLSAAEYLLAGGNDEIILCERGIRTFETTSRFTTDINSIPVVKELSHLPLIVDPSHSAGHSRLVAPVARAGLAAGADGLIIEVHAQPEKALSDGAQALDPIGFGNLMPQLRNVAAVLGRGMVAPPVDEPALAG